MPTCSSGIFGVFSFRQHFCVSGAMNMHCMGFLMRQAFDSKYTRKFFSISYLEHKTNDWVRGKIGFLVGPQEPLPATVKRRKLAWFGHVARTPRQPLQNHPSGYLGGWTTPWSAEEMLEGQRQRADVPAHARTARDGLPRKRLGTWSLLNRPSCPPNDPSS